MFKAVFVTALNFWKDRLGPTGAADLLNDFGGMYNG